MFGFSHSLYFLFDKKTLGLLIQAMNFVSFFVSFLTLDYTFVLGALFKKINYLNKVNFIPEDPQVKIYSTWKRLCFASG